MVYEVTVPGGVYGPAPEVRKIEGVDGASVVDGALTILLDPHMGPMQVVAAFAPGQWLSMRRTEA